MGSCSKKVNLKAPEVPQDVEQIEAFKRIWIDIFDNDFTELFDSGRFGENYGKLVSKGTRINQTLEQHHKCNFTISESTK